MLLSSCATPEKKMELSEADSAVAIVENTSQPKEAALPVDTNSIFGSYVGTFEAVKYKENGDITWTNMISIFIDSIAADTLYGHSVVAGSSTPFSGKWSDTKIGNLRAEVREPGTGKYDGVFKFDLDSLTRKLTGTWTANDSSLAVTERSFVLDKRIFTYDPKFELPQEFSHLPISEFTTEYESEEDEVGMDKAESTTEDAIKYNASLKLLDTKDVENMKRGDLLMIRNAIYARHGYTFRNRGMRYVFDNVSWYMPVSTDIRDDLTDIEKQNIALLKRYEEHAARYYDYFGR